MLNFFKKRQPIETRRNQRDLLSNRLAEAESATAKLALEAAPDTALAKAEQLIRQCEDRERTLRDAIAVFDSELAEVAAEAAAADRKVREATARELHGHAARIEKGLMPLLDAVRTSAADIETSGLAGFERELEAGSDCAIAALYARTIVLSDEAVPSFVASCRADATKILQSHWAAVAAVAIALDKHKTLDGVEIDTIIFAAESKATHEAEKQRRQRMVAMTKNSEVSKGTIGKGFYGLRDKT